MHLFSVSSMIVSQENGKGVQKDASFFTSGWIEPDKERKDLINLFGRMIESAGQKNQILPSPEKHIKFRLFSLAIHNLTVENIDEKGFFLWNIIILFGKQD